MTALDKIEFKQAIEITLKTDFNFVKSIFDSCIDLAYLDDMTEQTQKFATNSLFTLIANVQLSGLKEASNQLRKCYLEHKLLLMQKVIPTPENDLSSEFIAKTIQIFEKLAQMFPKDTT